MMGWKPNGVYNWILAVHTGRQGKRTNAVYGWISALDTNVSPLRPIATINLWEVGEEGHWRLWPGLALETALDKLCIKDRIDFTDHAQIYKSEQKISEAQCSK